MGVLKVKSYYESSCLGDNTSKELTEDESINNPIDKVPTIHHIHPHFQKNEINYSKSGKRFVRDMLRYLYLVIDASECMRENDSTLFISECRNQMTRLDMILKISRHFVSKYYDQNPLSNLGIVLCLDGEALMLSPLSTSCDFVLSALSTIDSRFSQNCSMNEGSSEENSNKMNISKDEKRLNIPYVAETGGTWSFQNGLELTGQSLSHIPHYGSREIVILVGSLSTCDPGDILVDTLPLLLAEKIRVNCIALSAELSICRKICEITGGISSVSLDGKHLTELIMGFVVPPPSLFIGGRKESKGYVHSCEFVPMGFPLRMNENIPTLVHLPLTSVERHGQCILATTGYVCPRCRSKVSNIPTECPVCSLKLVLSTHIARSFHHLFPVSTFVNITSHMLNLVPENYKNHTIFTPEKQKVVFQEKKKLSDLHMDSSFTKNYINTSEGLKHNCTDSDVYCFACKILINIDGIYCTIRKKEVKKGNENHREKYSNESETELSLKKKVYDKMKPLVYQCCECKHVFCSDCDVYIHETLHNCPGCLCK